MSENNVNSAINELYEIIQNAKAAMLKPDKCVIERETALSILDEIVDLLPSEIAAAKKIIDSRNELIMQARREAEATIKSADTQANEIVTTTKKEAEALITKVKAKAARMVEQEAIFIEAKKQSEAMLKNANEQSESMLAAAKAQCAEMVNNASARIDELKAASNNYMAESLRQTEAAIAASLSDVKKTKAKFEKLTTPKIEVAQPNPALKMFKEIDL